MNLRPKANAGLGSDTAQHLSLDNVSQLRNKAKWAKTAERYHALDNATDITNKTEKKEQRTWVKGQVETGGESQSSSMLEHVKPSAHEESKVS